MQPVPIKDGESELEKIKKRAERFGKIVSPKLEEELLKERAQKFGFVGPKLEEVSKKKRKERFSQVPSSGIVLSPEQLKEEEEKKRMRAERFGIKKD